MFGFVFATISSYYCSKAIKVCNFYTELAGYCNIVQVLVLFFYITWSWHLPDDVPSLQDRLRNLALNDTCQRRPMSAPCQRRPMSAPPGMLRPKPSVEQRPHTACREPVRCFQYKLEFNCITVLCFWNKDNLLYLIFTSFHFFNQENYSILTHFKMQRNLWKLFYYCMSRHYCNILIYLNSNFFTFSRRIIFQMTTLVRKLVS